MLHVDYYTVVDIQLENYTGCYTLADILLIFFNTMIVKQFLSVRVAVLECYIVKLKITSDIGVT